MESILPNDVVDTVGTGGGVDDGWAEGNMKVSGCNAGPVPLPMGVSASGSSSNRKKM